MSIAEGFSTGILNTGSMIGLAGFTIEVALLLLKIILSGAREEGEGDMKISRPFAVKGPLPIIHNSPTSLVVFI